jgi:hypothetical protein
MDTLSEILRDYVNVYRSDGMTGGALDPALAAEITNGNFRSVFDKYFDTSNPSTPLLSLELKPSEKTNFVNHQRDLVTAMLTYHTNNTQPGSPAVGEPQLNAVTSTRNPPHNKYWETLAVAAKIAQGGATVPTVPTGTVEPILVSKIRQYLSDVRLRKTTFGKIITSDYATVFVTGNPANDLSNFRILLKSFIPNLRTSNAVLSYISTGDLPSNVRQKNAIESSISTLY